MSLIQFRLTLSFSTSSMVDLHSFSTKEFYWLASCFWGIITCKLVLAFRDIAPRGSYAHFNYSKIKGWPNWFV
ncbi:hypothetical protein ES332_A10G296300v1 [Gossypium tomentosum]|uniref:Uncharacterized protein n=1 Tax=Gossypium tomentosum TaxID=34277 RepID=A0A5D2NWD8_GOSTO|nr:hypothetical protein ES332_A10G296300v1 [Gossypium tomentosum]